MALVIKCDTCGSSHGSGGITPAVSKTYFENKLVATFGAVFSCPIHGATPIVDPLCVRTYAEGLLIAKDGAICACGASLNANCVKTYAE